MLPNRIDDYFVGAKNLFDNNKFLGIRIDENCILSVKCFENQSKTTVLDASFATLQQEWGSFPELPCVLTAQMFFNSSLHHDKYKLV